MTKSFVVTDDMRQLMDSARTAFLQDSTYSSDVARAAASYMQRHRELPPREELPPAPAPYTCPTSHQHGSDRCVLRDRCMCKTCEASRAERAAQRRQDALERHQPREVTVRHVEPSKTLPEGAQQPGRHVKGTRQVTPVDRTPVKLPANLSHGTESAYGRFKCRCESCREFKSAVNRQTKQRAAERRALQQFTPRHPDDD